MIIIEIGVVLLLTLLNGVLAMSELAIVSSRKSRLEALADSGVTGARTALALIEDPSRFLSTVQIGITLIGVLAGAFSGATLAGPLGDALDRIEFIAPNGETVAFIAVVVAITYLSLIVGELVPKRIALADPERTAAFVARPMLLLSQIAAPAVWLLKVSSDAVLRLLGLAGGRGSTVTEDEVKSLIAEGTRAGIFAPQERAMIDGVLRLADRPVRVIMTKRPDIGWIDVGAGRAELLAALRENRYTRLLVCEGSVDHPLGVVDARDLAAVALAGDPVALSALMKPMLVASEVTPVLKLIDRFRREGVHFALIVDEYGTTEGIVTATDVLESIAGDLPERGEEAEPMVVTRADGSWLVDGLLPIDEFEDLVGIRGLAGDGGYDTLAGFVVAALGRLPKTGDRVVRPDLTLEVVDMDGRRIDKVAVAATREPPSA